MATLRMYLLGGLRVYHGQEPLPPFPTQKTRSLLAYLLTFRQRAHPRTLLAGTFWGNIPISQACRNLNTTLWRLRRVLPPGYVQIQGDSIGFDPAADHWLDATVFESTLRQAGLPFNSRRLPVSEQQAASLQQAVELYRGDYLEGFDEDWCLLEAERLRFLYLQALYTLLGYHRSRSQHEAALDCALRLLASDPLREDVHQQAMELYELLGRHGEALAQFAACRQLLQDELGVAPVPETLALYESIRAAGRPVSARPPPLPPPRLAPPPLPRTPFDDLGQVAMVDREREWATLTARIDAAGRGQGGVVLLEGEAGVGKSRLLQAAMRYAETRGWRVLRGAGHELREPPPYQAWTEALRPVRAWLHTGIPQRWLADLALLLPELRHLQPGLPPASPIPTPQRQEQLQQALLQCLRGMAQNKPTLVTLEDLQWADGPALEALRTIAPGLQDATALLIGTARTEEMPPRLREIVQGLEGTAAFERIALSRLSREDTGRLAGAVLGWTVPNALFVERLHQETQGNPFFAVEVLKGLFEGGRLGRDRAGQWNLSAAQSPEEEWPLPRGIRQAVQRRLERLDERSRQLLELAAVIGSEIDGDLLRETHQQYRRSEARAALATPSTSEGEEEAFLEISDDLLRRQLLVEVGERLHFAHGKIQQVIYRSIGGARRQQLHRLVGEILEKRAPERVEELAHHFYLGRQLGRALPYCLQAGERAFSVYAASAALSYYGWAIAAARRGSRAAARPALLRAHERRGQVYDHLGDLGSAVAEFEAMLTVAREAGDPAAVARAIRLAGWVRGYRQDNWEVGLREAQRAYDLAAAAGAMAEAAAARRDIGAYQTLRGDYQAGLEAHRAALAQARQTGDIVEEANNLQYIAVTHMFLSQNDQALEAFQQALAIRERLGDRWVMARILSNLGLLQINRGELPAAEQYLRRAEEEFQAIGALPALPIVWIGLATVYRYWGLCPESLQALGKALEVNSALGGGCYDRSLILFHRGCAQWDVGRPGSALADIHEGIALARQSNTPTLVVGHLNFLGHCLQQLGAAAEAGSAYQESLDLACQAAFSGGEATARAGLGLVEMARGNTLAGWTHLKQSMRLARPLGAHARGDILLALAEVAMAGWHLQAGRALARGALAFGEQAGVRRPQVHALLLAGEALAGLGRTGEGEAALRRALEQADPPGYPLLRWRILAALGHLLAEQGRAEEAGQALGQARGVAEEIVAGLPDEALREAFGALLPVRALLGKTEAGPLLPGQVRCRLARLGVPGGRLLREEERAVILWTVQAGAGDTALLERAGKAGLRRQRILRLLGEARAQGGDPSEADLARALGVSVRTLRSDVAALREKGWPVRTRGTREVPRDS
jgi:DNA-binding SARP family transcriptional activator